MELSDKKEKNIESDNFYLHIKAGEFLPFLFCHQ